MNHKFFSKIDTEEKAYWFGFICADGCIYNNRVILDIQIRDIEHLEKFKKSLVCDAKIRLHGDNNEYCRLNIYSKNLTKDLILHGCVPNKSDKLNYPKINADLEKDFIRGYFDGDGCIFYGEYWYKRKDCKSDKLYLRKLWLAHVIGTKSIVSGIKIFLGVKNNLYEISKKSNTYRLKFGGRQNCMKQLSKIYDGATIYLDRKYKKYEKLLTE